MIEDYEQKHGLVKLVRVFYSTVHILRTFQFPISLLQINYADSDSHGSALWHMPSDADPDPGVMKISEICKNVLKTFSSYFKYLFVQNQYCEESLKANKKSNIF